MLGFRAPEQSLGTVGGEIVDKLLGAASDLALVLDDRGVIRDMRYSSELAAHDLAQWIGSPWSETVARDSRDKVKDLLAQENDTAAKQRQINHRLPGGGNLMMLYSLVDLEHKPFRVAIGKDMSSLERMQQKLVNVQYRLEQDYQKLRQFEGRYHWMLRTSPDAVIVSRQDDLAIVEANDAAVELLGVSARRLQSMRLPQCFVEPERASLEQAVGNLDSATRSVTRELTSKRTNNVLQVSLSRFSADGEALVMARVVPLVNIDTESTVPDELQQRLHLLVDKAPDGLVISDQYGRIVVANAEFLDMAQVVSSELAEGGSLSQWLGFDAVDYQVIINSLQEHGSLRLYKTRMRGEHGLAVDVEVSAAAISVGKDLCFGFSIRNISRRVEVAADGGTAPPLVRSEDQLAQLVGRVPLKELVRESTDLIEQLCIEVALRKTGNNRASAAEILGLSRQSLYSKLNRYGIDS